MRRAAVGLLTVLALTVPAHGQSPSPRMDRLAAALRDDRLAVDPDVVYLLDARQQQQLRSRLRDTRVPVFVALLPALDEDESGGNQVRQLGRLYERVDERGVYVVVDQEGTMEVADAQVPLRLSLDYGTLRGELESEGTPREETVRQRLGEILDAVESAPAGEPGSLDATGIGDEALPALGRRRDAEAAAPPAVFVVGGLLGGAVLWGLTVVVAGVLRGRRA